MRVASMVWVQQRLFQGVEQRGDTRDREPEWWSLGHHNGTGGFCGCTWTRVRPLQHPDRHPGCDTSHSQPGPLGGSYTLKEISSSLRDEGAQLQSAGSQDTQASKGGGITDMTAKEAEMPNVGPEQILATELKQKERQEAQLAWERQRQRDHRHAPPGSRGRRTSIYGGTCLRVAP
ncbi:uncharacterized protein P174DRAFT_431758 [Aspergillus novofumigatus IBT 16806]|uniref:Uncharacterized protein n=1 Tax=Aspergillus novofumigatus (strain IBT 16806) TaxID=1392255 RepID=A0A2I1C3W9_ASPN1|nr:uncharacterized protein P174DRAFT_431758 [Aspergillus novofumigatus IBT 16806]PKX92329.1 hypothetical protein P174DRAFT_431758 [Aspergillus novofumigatus IBT 16806]